MRDLLAWDDSGMSEAADDMATVSGNPADWTEAQRLSAQHYGTCHAFPDCGAPRDVVTTPLDEGAFQMDLVCLNGHQGG